MASSSTVARSRQTQAVHSDDAVALRAAELAAWAKRNARIIVAAAAVVLVLLGGYVFYRVSKAREAAEAASAFLSLRANPTIETAAGTGQVEQFIREHDGTVEADEARLLLAELRLKANQPRQAVQPLTQLSNSGSPLAAQATMMLGAAQAQAGDRTAAIAAFERAAGAAKARYQKFEALGQAALMHEQSNNFQAAAGIYRRMLADADEGSAQYTVIQMRLTEALARAAR